MTTTPTAWKTSHPDSVGFYIASTTRRADFVRAWTGKHWTAPCHVGDVDLPGRMPSIEGPAAQPEEGKTIEWLEVVTLGGDGFISWGGLINQFPLKRDAPIEVRLRDRSVHRPIAPRDLCWAHGCGEADIVAYRIVPAEPLPVIDTSLLDGTTTVGTGAMTHAAGIGDVTSTAKGSGARYNAGKPDLALIPLRLIANSFNFPLEGPERDAQCALDALGEFQQTHEVTALYRAIDYLGLDGWEECAQVFEYGRQKYAAWNWLKGMAWSVPLACAARHCLAIMRGESVDPESGKPHRGHIKCNIVMLLTFVTVFPEGNDLPTQWLAEVPHAA